MSEFHYGRLIFERVASYDATLPLAGGSGLRPGEGLGAEVSLKSSCLLYGSYPRTLSGP